MRAAQAVAVALAIVAPACLSRVRRADDLVAAGRPDEARALLDAALAEAPGDVEARFALGRLHAGQERWLDAEAALRQCLDRAPDHRAARELLAGVLDKAGAAPEAAFQLGELRRLFGREAVADPAYRDALLDAAEGLLSAGEHPGGIELIDRAVAEGLTPYEEWRGRLASAWSAHAAREASEGRRDAAVTAWEQAQRHDPENAQHPLARGRALVELERGLDARQAFAEHIALSSPTDEGRARAAYLVGRWFEGRAEAAAAAEHYERAAALDPSNGDVLLALGRQRLTLRDVARAREALARHVALAGGGADVLRRVGEEARALGARRLAEEYLDQALRQDPRDAATALALVRLMAARGAREEARAVMRGFVDAAEDPGAALFAAAEWAAAQDDDAFALEAYEDSARRNPTRPVTFLRLYDLYRDAGRAADADRAFDRYVAAAPDKAAAHATVADLLRAERRHDAAAAHLRKAAALRPDDPGPWRALARVHREARRAEDEEKARWEEVRRSADRGAALLAIGKDFNRREDWPRALRFLTAAGEAADLPVRRRQAALFLVGEVHWKARDRPKMREADLRYLELAETDGGRARCLERLAERYERAGLPEDRLWALQELVRIEPERAELHLSLGGLQLQRADRDSADAAFRRYVARSADQVAALHAVATKYRMANDYDSALAAYRRIRDVAPGDPRFLQYTAEIYRARDGEGDRQRAAALYDELLAGAQADALDLGKVAHGLFLGQFYAQAATAYERALAGKPLRGAYAQELAICQLQLGRHDRAREVFDAWLEGEGGEARSHLEVARRYRDASHYDDALRHYQAVVDDAGPELDEAYGEAADVLARRGDGAALSALTERYLGRAREEVRARQLAAEKLAAGGLREAAVGHLRRVLALRAGGEAALRRLVDLLWSLGRADEAAGYVARLVEEGGGQARAWLQAGHAVRARGALEAALEFYGRALSPTTDRSEVQLQRGELLLSLGRWEEAEEALDDAIAAARSKRTPLEKVGALLERFARPALIEAHWARATSLDPSHAPHHERLVLHLLDRGQTRKARRALLAARAQAPAGLEALAEAFESAGWTDLAAQIYEEVLEAGLDQRLKEAFERLAAIRLGQGAAEALAPAVERFVAVARSRPDAHQAVAAVFARAGRYGEAHAHISQAVREEPTEERLALAARYALADGRDREAVEALVGRVDRSEAPDELAEEIVRDLVGRGRADLAERLAYLLELRRGGADVAGPLLARLRLIAGDVPGALRAARAHVAEGADPSAARRKLAQDLRERGLSPEAEELLEEAAGDPEVRPDVLLDLAEMRYDRDDVAGGRAALDAWLDAQAGKKPSEELAFLAGAVLHGAGRWAEAADLLAEAARHPRSDSASDALKWRLMSLSALGRDDEALARAAREFIEARPDRRAAWEEAVRAVFEIHRLDLAAALLDEALASFPGEVNLVDFLVAVHVRRGDDARVRDAVRQFLLVEGQGRDKRLHDLAGWFERELRWDQSARLRTELLELAPGMQPALPQIARAEILGGAPAAGLATLRRYVDAAPDRRLAAREAALVLLEADLPAEAGEHARAALGGPSAAGDGDARAQLAAIAAARRAAGPWRELADAYVRTGRRPALFAARRALFHGRAPRLGAPAPAPGDREPVRALLSGPDGRPAGPEEAVWSLVASLDGGGTQAADALVQAVRAAPAAFLPDPLDSREPGGPDPPPSVPALAADALLRAGREEQADAVMMWWVATADDPAATLHQGAFELARRRRSGALMRRWLAELDRRYPGHSAKVTLLAETLEASGDLAGAEAAYRQALARSPRAGVYMNNLAYLLARSGRSLPEALDLVRAAERMQPQSNKYYYDTEGWVLYRLGRLEEARDRISASIRLMNARMGPTVSESFYHLGAVCRDLRRDAEARWAFQTAAVMDPWGEYGAQSREALDAMTRGAPGN